MEQKTPQQIKFTKGHAIGFAVLALILFVIAISGSDSSDTQKNQPKQEEMNLEIKRSITEKDFSGVVVTIKNLNSFEWNDCKIFINNDYRKDLAFIGTPSKLATTEDPRDYMILPTGAFAKSDGTRFNGNSQKIMTVVASCSKPYTSTFSGGFN